MQEPGKPRSLESLGDNISRIQKQAAPKKRPPSGASLAMQSGLELVSGVAVGSVVGIGLDRWLGTSPFLLILCFFLGAAGGFLTLYRTAMAQGDDESNASQGDDSHGA